MGRATITGGGTDGLYQIHMDYGTERVAMLLAPIDARIAELQGWMTEKTAQYDAKKAEGEADKIAAIDEAMNAYAEEKDRNCSPELWNTDPVAVPLADLRFAINAQNEKRDEIGRLNEHLIQATSDLADLTAVRDAAEEAYNTARDAADSAETSLLNAYEALIERQYICEDILGDYNPSCWADEVADVAYWELENAYRQSLAYDAQVIFDAAEGDVEAMEITIDDLNVEIETQEGVLETLNEKANEKSHAYQDALVDRAKELERCDPALLQPQIAAINKTFKKLQEYRAELDKLRVQLRLMAAELAGLLLRKARLEALPAEMLEKDVSAWCVDLTEDLTGEVGTIEIPGEPTNAINIVPGYTDASPTSADGQLISREVMSPEQVFFNSAILPGWQKWMPMYRVGEIVDIDYDADTASVFLDDSKSSEVPIYPPTQHPYHLGGSRTELDVNQLTWNLDDIPVVYMECNAAAFDVGDRVVVQFAQPTATPKADPASVQATVIGFESDPQPCEPVETYLCKIEEEYPRGGIVSALQPACYPGEPITTNLRAEYPGRSFYFLLPGDGNTGRHYFWVDSDAVLTGHIGEALVSDTQTDGTSWEISGSSPSKKWRKIQQDGVSSELTYCPWDGTVTITETALSSVPSPLSAPPASVVYGGVTWRYILTAGTGYVIYGRY